MTGIVIYFLSVPREAGVQGPIKANILNRNLQGRHAFLIRKVDAA